MSNVHKYGFLLSYVDMLYAVLTSILVLFILMFVLINVHHTKKTGKINTNAQIEVVMTWKPNGVANDIDLWVRPPYGTPIGYSHMQNTFMNLNRDDLGKSNDFAIINGKKVVIKGHREVTQIRKKVPGHYVVNAEFYAVHESYVPGQSVATPVTIKLIRVNPSYKVLVVSHFVLQNQGDEHTAFQFDIGKDGKVKNIITNEQVPFVFAAMARNRRMVEHQLESGQGAPPR